MTDKIVQGVLDENFQPKEAMKLSGGMPTAKTPDLMTKATGKAGGFDIGKAGAIAGGVMDGAQGIMSLASMDFDTSADGGGVGNKANAMLSGAGSGIKAGANIGKLAGPLGQIIGTGVGAIGGGIIGAIKQGKAQEEYLRNVKNDNLKESEEEKTKRAQQYMREQGLAEIQSMKKLKQSELGII